MDNMEDITIIGLTGPVGSGCTTLSKLFDDDDKNKNMRLMRCAFLNYLINEKKYLKIHKGTGRVTPNYKTIDNEIATLFEKLEELDKRINISHNEKSNAFDSYLNNEMELFDLTQKRTSNRHLFKIKRKLFYELRILLEKRETLKALEWLENYIDIKEKRYRFSRISISDLIIFLTLGYKEKDIKGNSAKKKQISNYLTIIKRHKDVINEIIDLIKEVNPEARSISDIEGLIRHERSYGRRKLIKIAKILTKTSGLSRKIKNEFSRQKKNYRILMQDFGDNIRKNGIPFDYGSFKPENVKKYQTHITLAEIAELLINFFRNYFGHNLFIIDSFKNPYEAMYFKDKYTKFYLFSLNAPLEVRKERHLNKSGSFDTETDERDQGIGIKKIKDQFYMQNVPKTVKLSDVALNNNKNYFDENNKPNMEKINSYLCGKMIRYLALIFDTGCTKPTGDEVMMNLAYTMAMRSNCISRQVGAVIKGRDGYVVGAGWNDVGKRKISCGLRQINDLKSFPSWYKNYVEIMGDDITDKLISQYSNNLIPKEKVERFCFCFKDEYSASKNIEKIERIKLPKKGEEKVKSKLKIKKLEYCEALHAEENAIIQSSKIGGTGLQGGKIYTTAFPCELCAKKIHQVGINEIIFTEPYPENISEPIFLHNTSKKIKLKQFEGVMPYSYIKLFKVFDDQKDWQRMFVESLVE
jgi:deoxycytidylate deaminase